jgi:hypothetical protein
MDLHPSIVNSKYHKAFEDWWLAGKTHPPPAEVPWKKHRAEECIGPLGSGCVAQQDEPSAASELQGCFLESLVPAGMLAAMGRVGRVWILKLGTWTGPLLC